VFDLPKTEAFEDLPDDVMLLHEGSDCPRIFLPVVEVPADMREPVYTSTGGLQGIPTDQDFHSVFEEYFHLVGSDHILNHAQAECSVIQLLPCLI